MSRQGYVDPEEGNQNAAHRVIIGKTYDDGDQQLVDYKGLAGEEHTKVVRVMPHGLVSHAPEGSEGIVLALGDRDMPMLMGVESPKHRPKNVPAGGTMLYDTDGTKVYLTADGKLLIESSGEVTIKSGKLKIEADIEITGNITHKGNYTQDGVHIDSNGPHTA